IENEFLSRAPANDYSHEEELAQNYATEHGEEDEKGGKGDDDEQSWRGLNAAMDKFTRKFSERVEFYPDQVLRYIPAPLAASGSADSAPLWWSSQNRLLQSPPPCS